MVLGPLGKLLAPIGIVLVVVSVTVTVLAFLVILLNITGDVSGRLRLLAAGTALPLAVGGAALVWIGK